MTATTATVTVVTEAATASTSFSTPAAPTADATPLPVTEAEHVSVFGSGSDSGCFRLCRMAGKGLGVVAARDLEPGESILQEEPLVSVQLSDTGDLLGQHDKGEFRSWRLDQQLVKLSDVELREFYSLTDAFTRHNSGGRKSNFGIIKTNSFSVTLRKKLNLVLFPRIARLNHSCWPNCHHYWSGQTGRFVVRAVRPIRRGQEICISYMSPLQRADFHDRESRRRILEAEFGFGCLCDLCVADGQEENDSMRRRVLEIESAWSQLGVTPEAALEMGEEQFELCSQLKLDFQAGLLSYVALHCVEAASLLVAKKKAGVEAEAFRSKAAGYARKAMALAGVAYGQDSEEYPIFQAAVLACEHASNLELLGDVQAAIMSLRDLD